MGNGNPQPMDVHGPAQGANSSPAWAVDFWGSALQCSDRAAAATSPAPRSQGKSPGYTLW